jgi:hypothetical protein
MAYSKIGTELVIDSGTGNERPSVTTLADGGFLVSWISREDPSQPYVLAERYDALGNVVQAQTVVATATDGISISDLNVVALKEGGYAFSWVESSLDDTWLTATMFNASGAKVASGVQINQGAIPRGEIAPVMAAIGSGFSVGWMSLQDGETVLKDPVFRLFSDDGTALTGEILASEAPGTNQYSLSLAQTLDGNIVVTWHDGRDDTDIDGSSMGTGEIQARIFTAGGAPFTGEIEVNAQSYGTQENPDVTALANGGFVVAWGSSDDHYLGYGQPGIRLQVYAHPGSHYGEIYIPEASYTSKPTVTALTDGNFVVSWMNPDDLGNAPLMLQVYNSTGERIGTPVQVDEASASITIAPSVTPLADGRFVVNWWDYGQIKAQVFGISDGSTDPVDPNPGDENQAPSLLYQVGGHVDENSAAGTAVSTLYAVDMDFLDPAGETLTFSLTDNAGGRFAIQGDKIVVANGALLDFEQAASHQVTVRVTDRAGAYLDEQMTIAVQDVNEAPVVEPPVIETPVITPPVVEHPVVHTPLTVSTNFTLPDYVLNVIAGGRANIKLTGNALDNSLKGNAGKNIISGGGGKDKVNGWLGNDKLAGGKDKDAFLFTTKLGTYKTDRKVNFDTVTDFLAKDDSVWLDNAIFKALGKKGSEGKPALLSKKFFTVGSEAKDKDDYIIFNKKTGVLSYDADGSGTKYKAVEFAQLKKGLSLKYNDFFVI